MHSANNVGLKIFYRFKNFSKIMDIQFIQSKIAFINNECYFKLYNIYNPT